MREIVLGEAKENKSQAVEKFKNMNPEKEMTVKELKDAVKFEFNKAAEEAKKEEQESAGLKEHVDDKYREGDKLLPDTEFEVNGNIENIKKTDVPEKKGGSYAEVFKGGEGDKFEVHHMPADCASDLKTVDGPAIKMEKEDHPQTASWGSTREAREYRAKQKELIEQGKFREALQMDIEDIHEKFDNKYDDAISEMLEYVDKLEAEGKING